MTVLHVQVWRGGSFGIELNEPDKEKILAQDDIIVLNDYGVCVEELYSGAFHKYEIQNRDIYDEEEMEEIHKMMFCEDGEDEEDEEEDEDEEDEEKEEEEEEEEEETAKSCQGKTTPWKNITE